MQPESSVTGYCLVTLNTVDTYYSVETKFNDFNSISYLKKNCKILLFYCKRNGIPLSTHFARPIVRSVLA